MTHRKLAWSLLTLYLLYRHVSTCRAAVACSETSQCEKTLLPGSVCVAGVCTNPFYSGGCLRQMLPGWKKVRVCNSDDPPYAVAKGFCKPSSLDFMEIRINSMNWESAFFGAWILQILLSEMLDVPVSLETGFPNLSVDFYNENSSLDYGKGMNWQALAEGARIGDCRLLRTSRTASTEYHACSHFFPEVWQDALANASQMQRAGIIESPLDLGVTGEGGWFVPRFTGKRHPNFVSYLGMQGEDYRQKLAETFKRPTSWKDYCERISNSGCRSPDTVAIRAPIGDKEGSRFYAEGLYSGYFRATEQNDCQQNPTNCTGHIVDFPCGWSSFVPQQTYWLDIALESNGPEPSRGYSYDQMTQIWAASNATKSDVIMVWWSPELLYQSFIGTDAELVKVVLPPTTQSCLNARADPLLRCGGNSTVVRGREEGSCGSSAQSLKKIMGGGLRKALFSSGIDEARWSPAYQALINYKITEGQLGEIFNYWQDSKMDPRQATCRWVIENLAFVKSFVPPSYPRLIKQQDVRATKLFPVAIVIASICMALLFTCVVGIYLKRKKNTIYHAQVELLYLFECGFALVTVGALLLVLRPSDMKCISIAWLTNIGYCFALVPLYTRVSEINLLLNAGKHMQRVRLSKRKLFGSVLSASCLVSAFLVVWTLVDGQKQAMKYKLTGETTPDGEAIVLATNYCSSGSLIWSLFSVGWQALLLLISLVLAVTASSVREDLNQSRVLTGLLVSSFLFVILRFSLTLLTDSINQSHFSAYLSIVYSLECIATNTIYVVPKILNKSTDEKEACEADPDLFIDATILVAEITGFTAWSSVREPNQVFRFLEMLYQAFDDLAEKRRVFKVETVGESYVAATGIPHVRHDHAVAMVRFSIDCMVKTKSLCHELEIVFGPDTGDLSLRIGIHSGPVTGGFLKGKGARFQLFGDTMNTTSQVARSGERGRIQLSEDTANLLVKAGKGRWIEKREDRITTVKGDIQTYWVNQFRGGKVGDGDCTSSHAGSSDVAENDLWRISHEEEEAHRKQRLIDWNVEVLHRLLKQIVGRRNAAAVIPKIGIAAMGANKKMYETASAISESKSLLAESPSGITDVAKMPLGEVKEIITLPSFDHKVAGKQKDPETIDLPEAVVSQLKCYVTRLAAMYRDNPFHSFAHASHVVMSVIKHMNRIIAPKQLNGVNDDENAYESKKIAALLHDHTYGITSDPLTQFACVFSALIHDLDHPGVPNTQLIQEDPVLASRYHNRSVAEQNSFDLAWNLLAEKQFDQLRATIYGTKDELSRFRQLVINSVMATDLGDKELKALRNARWETAFSTNEDETTALGKQADAINRKATIVIEHLIQSADVSHTMQHWDIYREWNEKLFREMYLAYRYGRAEKNPADSWYEGEIGFFDYYIIPLSKKLSECGVFGVSSDENLNYATKNRDEWVGKGRQVVAEMLKKAETEWGNVQTVL